MNNSTSVHKKHIEISAQKVGEQPMATRLLLACRASGIWVAPLAICLMRNKEKRS